MAVVVLIVRHEVGEHEEQRLILHPGEEVIPGVRRLRHRDDVYNDDGGRFREPVLFIARVIGDRVGAVEIFGAAQRDALTVVDDLVGETAPAADGERVVHHHIGDDREGGGAFRRRDVEADGNRADIEFRRRAGEGQRLGVELHPGRQIGEILFQRRDFA